MTKSELLKISKPILFNTEMVRAILEGRKTVTRRVIKPKLRDGEYGFNVWYNEITGNHVVEKYDEDENSFCPTRYVNPPYSVGDILYVRETFNDIETDTILYAADEEFIDFGCKRVDDYLFMESEIKWKPSIHMPKSAARIFLRITDVRVERLQDITEEQAIKEGVEGIPCDCKNLDSYGSCEDCCNYGWWEPPVLDFHYVWDHTIKKQDLDRYGWQANPWVWVYEFERMEEE